MRLARFLLSQERRAFLPWGIPSTLNCYPLCSFMDVNTYIRSLTVTNFRTLDKLGPNATLLRGQLGAVEGIPVIVSEQMAPADIDGKVTGAGNAQTRGRLLITNRTQWRVGYRRGTDD